MGIFTELTRMRLLMASTDSELGAIYRTWANGLSDMSESQIKMGLVKARNFDGFFSLPAFRELCTLRPEDCGLPDAHAAYVEAANADGQRDRARWSHAAVYHAARETGWFELRTSTEREVFPLFRRNYEAMCARVMVGEQLDLPVQRALPASVTPRPAPRAEARRRIASLRAMLEG